MPTCRPKDLSATPSRFHRIPLAQRSRAEGSFPGWQVQGRTQTPHKEGRRGEKRRGEERRREERRGGEGERKSRPGKTVAARRTEGGTARPATTPPATQRMQRMQRMQRTRLRSFEKPLPGSKLGPCALAWAASRSAALCSFLKVLRSAKERGRTEPGLKRK